jgi:uncharacterized protein YgbK (DUF1537 family)
MKVKKHELLGSLPPEWPEDLLPTIQALVKESGTKIVVLDDDPTGNQTVHDVPVLTEWSPASLRTVLAEPGAVVYVLTNSRSVTLPQAQAMNREIATNLRAASDAAGRDFVVVSRSDSTLRGHYPGEVEALVEGLGQTFDGTLIIPFFLEGGRLTIHDTHYVIEGDWLTPAAETEYARDTTFGYQNSDLRAWVSEKHQGKIKPQDVATIPLADLRTGGPDAVAATLSRVNSGQVCVVNAATYRDMEVFVTGLLRVEAAGQRFVYRTAASFVRVRGGIAPRNLLTAADLVTSKSKNGGLIVVGSYVKKSTLQVEAAQSLPGITSLEVSVENLLDANSHDDEIRRVAGMADESLSAGRDALVYTSRRLITGVNQVSSLQIGQVVSTALVTIVESLSEVPAWLIAKGGITSSDIATKGLRIKRAEVLGQALPGIPIWRTGQESRWPGLVYVVFPGNVGGPNALAEMIQTVRGRDNVSSQKVEADPCGRPTWRRKARPSSQVIEKIRDNHPIP